MKEKITLAISIGCAALILTLVMFTQFKTVDQTDITAIETMRETELRTELANWKSKYEEIETKMEEQEIKINEYKQELSEDETSSKILEQEVKDAERLLGYTEAKGEGIIVTLADTDMKDVEDYELIKLVNELNIAGAEAISINDERIVANSDITFVNNSIVLVNARKVSGPYVVKAIGDKKYLESSLSIKNGYLDQVKVEEIDIEYEISDNIVIPAYNGELVLKYTEDNKDNKNS